MHAKYILLMAKLLCFITAGYALIVFVVRSFALGRIASLIDAEPYTVYTSARFYALHPLLDNYWWSFLGLLGAVGLVGLSRPKWIWVCVATVLGLNLLSHIGYAHIRTVRCASITVYTYEKLRYLENRWYQYTPHSRWPVLLELSGEGGPDTSCERYNRPGVQKP